MLNKIRRNKRKKYQYGGKVKVDFPMPEVQHGTTQDALKAQQESTKKANDEQLAMNKSGGSKAITVPQLGSAAGDAGNEEIANQIAIVNQGKADQEFDKEAPVVPKPKSGGKRKTKKRKRKSKIKKGGHCGNQLKIVKKLLNKTKKNKTKKNIRALKKHMKILTKKIKEYDNPKKGLRKNKSHINRYKKLRRKFNRLL